MEAKDTVIEDKDSDLIKCPNCQAQFVILYHRIREDQAEISFKIGKTLGVAESLKPALKAIEDSRKAGIKEAMGWIHSPCPHTGGLEEEQIYVEDCPKCCKAQLKKWGIK